MALRVAAYALCVRDGSVLLAHWHGTAAEGGVWTLPGGGLDPGEDPLDAAVREVREETGYAVEVTALLGVDALTRVVNGGGHHSLRVLYEAVVTGGDLTFEVGGSTDKAAWFPLDAVPDLPHATMVDTAFDLAAKRPATGRLR
jgi:ADP-ribose pyrophosphatase YjhB (NUDIX family)